MSANKPRRKLPKLPAPQTEINDGHSITRRNASGQYLPGTKAGPGNPHANRLAAYRVALTKAITPEDIHAIIRAMIKAAVAGDVAAAYLVLERALGKPVQPVDFGVNGIMPIKIVVLENPGHPEHLAPVVAESVTLNGHSDVTVNGHGG